MLVKGNFNGLFSSSLQAAFDQNYLNIEEPDMIIILTLCHLLRQDGQKKEARRLEERAWSWFKFYNPRPIME